MQLLQLKNWSRKKMTKRGDCTSTKKIVALAKLEVSRVLTVCEVEWMTMNVVRPAVVQAAAEVVMMTNRRTTIASTAMKVVVMMKVSTAKVELVRVKGGIRFNVNL
jgi:hypothetical protein